jgi:hypothetical protein
MSKKKTSITVGLKTETLEGVELARDQMRRKVQDSSFPMLGMEFSRSMIIDVLLQEALEARGIGRSSSHES